MNQIKSSYTNYLHLIDTFGEEKIQRRYEFLYQEIKEYIERLNAQDKLVINERILMHTVLEYFEDISKLKKSHDLEHSNEPKVIAYTSYWILRRKPIQLTANEESEELVFANEKFVLSFIIQYLTKGNETLPLVGNVLDQYKGFLNSLYYYIKFRKLDAQSFELILLAFQAGKLFS